MGKVDKCYIYTRVSTTMQVEGYSLDAQLDTCKKYANFLGANVVRVYTDEAKSGKGIEGRINFQQMLSDVQTHRDNVSAVLVFKLSRFARNSLDALQALEILENNDVILYSVEDGINTSNSVGKTLIAIFTAIAEMERENILVQTQAGRNQKAREGKWNGGKAPFGYNLTPKVGKLTINEEEAIIVRAIFQKYVNEKKTVHAIVSEINAEYKRPKRNKNDTPLFNEYNIRRILDDISYTGVISYGRTVTDSNKKTASGKPLRKKQTDESKIIRVPGSFDAIIDDETWALAKKRRDAERGKKRRPSSPNNHIYPLSGLIKCPVCGRALNGHVNKGKISKKTGEMGEDTFGYGCKNHPNAQRGDERCTFSRQLNEDKLCEEILKIIKAIAINKNVINLVSEKINAAVDVSEMETMNTKLSKELNKTIRNAKNVTSEIDDLDPDSDTYEIEKEHLVEHRTELFKKQAELKQQIEDVSAKIEAVYSSKYNLEKIKKILEGFGKFYSKFTEQEKRTYIQLLIESIELQNYDDRRLDYSKIIKSITFKFPINNKDGDEAQIYLTDETDVESVVLMSRG